MKHKVYFSLGSNLGDKEGNIREAISRIGELIGEVDRQSTLLATEPWGFESDNTFVNAAIRCTTSLSPFEILNITQNIERAMGRTLKSVDGQYHDRIIDIDILIYDDLHITTPQLTLPHPLMKERDFVMIPLKEILQIG
ncbi:MAG: 2-amino-4-hydroxy-6-hydroxymethyldihydropteridine diphosphokinase [Prevotellaceae bacterium]|nr:2-amino-4-hydroxy-6-hydroxymethyldihydropteridine diphosphokinase [Prevotellaceae bacterium]